MHIQNLIVESLLLSPIYSLPLCSLLHTNFSINLTYYLIVIGCCRCCALRVCQSKKVSVSPWLFPLACLVPILYSPKIFSRQGNKMHSVFNHDFHSLHYFQSLNIIFRKKSKYSFLNFLLLCFRTIQQASNWPVDITGE